MQGLEGQAFNLSEVSVSDVYVRGVNNLTLEIRAQYGTVAPASILPRSAHGAVFRSTADLHTVDIHAAKFTYPFKALNPCTCSLRSIFSRKFSR
jgi:hypothetical protein